MPETKLTLDFKKKIGLKEQEMPKKKGGNKLKQSDGQPSTIFSTAQESYIKALEQEVKEHRLRVLLYQNVLSTASEEYGEDILKKIGTHQSGP